MYFRTLHFPTSYERSGKEINRGHENPQGNITS